MDKTFKGEAPCQAYADGETKTEKENSLGCRTDWGTGLCNTWEVTPDSTGCAVRISASRRVHETEEAVPRRSITKVS